MPRSDAVAAYLRCVGLDADLPATLETLVALHRAHLDRIPYENLGIMLGRSPSVDPAASLARVGEVGRAGYCFHQNGCLELVLRELGFQVGRRHGHVGGTVSDRADTELNHLVLVVDGLPTPDNPGGRWWVDAGLGDAFRDPLPVTVGRHDQDGFRYEITSIDGDSWSYSQGEGDRLSGVEIRALPIGQPEVDAAHARLSAPADGRFARIVVVQRRDADGIDTVRGCLHHRTLPEGNTETELSSYDAWRAALVDGTHLSLEGVADDELRALYSAQWDKHLAWTAAGRP